MLRLRRGASLALALSLGLISGAFAGDNAGATHSLTSASSVAGVGPGETITLEISVANYVGVKQLDVIVEVGDGANFTLTSSSLTLPAATFAGWIPLPSLPVSGTTNQVRLGASLLDITQTQPGVVGDATFSINLVTSGTFSAATQASITVASISIGPSNSARDVFTAAALGLNVTLNPPVSDPTLTASTPTDVSKDFSAVGSGAASDGSAGEVTFGVSFADASGAATAGQSIAFAVTNNGAEMVYANGTSIAAGANRTVTVATNASGNATILLDAEGGKTAGSTSASVTATTTANNSEGTALNLSASFAVTWDVPVPAELAAFDGSVTPENHVLLSWAVPSQSNNLGWEVYRSSDNETFERVGDMVTGEGTVNESRTYEFLDEELPVADFAYYYLRQVDFDGSGTRSQTIEMALTPVRVLPTAMSLMQNYPNPFNPETTIRFDVASQANVSVRIYDITGQVVRTLMSGVVPAGSYTELWDGRSDAGVRVGSGVYFYELEAGSFTSMKKMTLVQ
jgi:hypothetical protein